MFESQKGKNLAAVIFKVNVIMNHQCEGLGFFVFFFSCLISYLLLFQFLGNCYEREETHKSRCTEEFNQLFT